MNKITRIEDLPENFDESIYQNEYDGRVNQIIQNFKNDNVSEKRAQEE